MNTSFFKYITLRFPYIQVYVSW